MFLWAIGVGVAGLALFLGYQAWTWPDVASLAESAPESWAFLERARSQGREPRHSWARYDAISPELKIAVLVAEDISFFEHEGFDTHEIKLAISEAWRGERKLRGASTITQQLAKNLFLTPSRNPWRKVEEAVLTWQLERELGKRRILELYLNVVEFGPGLFGAEAASRHYFGRPAARLSRNEAARLAASLPHSAWHPAYDSASYLRHVATVERRMEQASWLRRSI